MRLVSYGDAKSPTIVMNNGSFCSERSLAGIAEDLARDLHVVVAVVDGSDGGAEPYVSTEHQAQKILSGLAGEGVTQVALLHGLSMGAEVALETFRQAEAGEGAGAQVAIARTFFDGGPFLHLNALMRRIMLGKFSGMIGRMASKPEEASVEAFRQSKAIRRIAGTDVAGYEPMLRDVWQTAQTIGREQVEGQVATCYTCDPPAFDEATQGRMYFQWCEKEKARDAEQRIRDAYPHAHFDIVPGLGHGGMAVFEPEAYAERIRGLAQG